MKNERECRIGGLRGDKKQESAHCFGAFFTLEAPLRFGAFFTLGAPTHIGAFITLEAPSNSATASTKPETPISSTAFASERAPRYQESTATDIHDTEDDAMNLRDKILRALYGSALLGTALGVNACADEPVDNNDDNGWNIEDPWKLETNNANNQTPNNVSPNNTTPNNQTANNIAANNTVANNIAANNQTSNNISVNNTTPNNVSPNNTTIPPDGMCEELARDRIELPYDGWRTDAYSFEHNTYYVVCAPLDAFECKADLEPEEIQEFVRAALPYDDFCEPNAFAYPESGYCGPLARRSAECCYAVELGFDYCLEGRPFTVDGQARLANVQQRTGWCEPLELGVDLDALPEDLRIEIAESWGEAGTHEHASVASFARFMMDLMSLGAPRSLVEATTKAIDDEIRHANACFSIGSVYAGYPLGPDEVDVRGAMEHAGDEVEILRAAILEGCIGETIAATQAAWSAPRVRHTAIREALEAISDEEGDHALLAWQFVDWMLETRPHLVDLARQTFIEAFEPATSPFAQGLSEREREALAHGRVSPALEDRIRRHAFHHTVIPCAQALLEKRGSGETITWPGRVS